MLTKFGFFISSLAISSALAADYGFDAPVKKVIGLKDGRVAVFGDFDAYGARLLPAIMRLNSHGGLVPGALARNLANLTGTVSQMLLAPDASVVMIGSFAVANDPNYTKYDLISVRPDGGLKFMQNAGVSGGWMRLSPDGKFFIVTSQGYVTRLNADGTSDAAFGNNFGQSNADVNQLTDLRALPDGSFFVTGNVRATIRDAHNNVKYDQANLIHFNADGSLDQNFHSKVAVAPVAMQLRASDNAMALGFNSGELLMLNADGSVMPAFKFVNVSGQPPLQLGFDSVGNLYLLTGNTLQRVKSDGTVDAAFASAAFSWSKYRGNQCVSQFEVEANDELLVSGNCDTFKGAGVPKLVLLRRDGSLDTGFSIPYFNGAQIFGGANATVRAVALADGEVVIAPSSNWVGGTPLNGFAVLNADGGVDRSFRYADFANVADLTESRGHGFFILGNRAPNSDTTLTKTDHEGAALADFRPISLSNTYGLGVAEDSRGYVYLLQGDLTRYTPRGAADASFTSLRVDADNQFNSNRGTVVVDALDRVWVGGQTLSRGDLQFPGLVRLLPDGSFDPGFNTGGAFSEVAKIIPDVNGRAIVQLFETDGDLSHYPRIVALFDDGRLDANFAIMREPVYPENQDYDVNWTMSRLPDGRLVLYTGGYTARVNNVAVKTGMFNFFDVTGHFTQIIGDVQNDVVISRVANEVGDFDRAGNFVFGLRYPEDTMAGSPLSPLHFIGRLNPQGKLDTSYEGPASEPVIE